MCQSACKNRILYRFYIKGQQGSHIILRRDNPFAQVVVPNHKELDKGTLRSIIRQAEIEVNEFIKLRRE